ncbi:MAG: glycosyltransferase [Actinobacteria bacterium]|nr:glycosyltransferase [Actinomycetota bacterium]MBW3642811.1 glycosyltransferase [Actinomycetota bacterium]
MSTEPDYTVVVPSVGRPSLEVLLDALAAGGGPPPREVLVIDDRRRATSPILERVPIVLAGSVRVLSGPARGPAAARNVGWRAATTAWISFLDDDVVPVDGWAARLADDLAHAPADVVGSQGRIVVPLPSSRPPTDWERNVSGLESACWATADLAYRRSALVRVGGFDERFPRAYREDADLGLRLAAVGGRIARGGRVVHHPVRPAPWWVSLRLQAGNADDVLMAALHGRRWRRAAGAPAGRFVGHAATTAAGTAALGLAIARRRRAARVAGAAWAASTVELAWARIAPGPRTPAEVGAMVATSLALPAAATAHHLWGRLTLRRRLAAPGAPRPEEHPPRCGT